MTWTKSYKHHNGIEQGEGIAPVAGHEDPRSGNGCQCDGTGESTGHDTAGGCKAERSAAAGK